MPDIATNFGSASNAVALDGKGVIVSEEAVESRHASFESQARKLASLEAYERPEKVLCETLLQTISNFQTPSGSQLCHQA